jgi:anti-sigma factor RsiW
MNENVHERAQRLMAEAIAEKVPPADEAWLRAHLAACAECARGAAATQEALAALRSVAVSAPRDLAARTQLRVRLRAQELSRTAGGNFWLWMVTGASWALGVLSAPLVWKAFSWAGGNFGVPKLALEIGFVLWWTVPGLIAMGVVLHQRATSAGSRGI